MATRLLKSVAFLFLAEWLASSSVWSGTPTDWRGAPPSFWGFERWRLQYWILFGSLSLLLWLVAWYTLNRRVHVAGLVLLAAVLAVADEILTSVLFWPRLSFNQTAFFGLATRQEYLQDHFMMWSIIVAVGLGIWYALSRKKARAV
ncbi:MAG TPA: hypothetical protein VKB26_08875 [Candidatus Acidoferrales bacterium]|nr:hypothetical protein [Candidatus Acidoferrales bacterium]